MSEKNELGVLTALILGGLIGAAAGVLMAPAKGEVTRGKIKGWAEDTWDDETEKLEELKEEIEKKIAKKKKQIGKKINQIKDEIAEAVLEEEDR
ncbi:gas vesicle protein [Elusimicrobium posterum]|uniref:YtxH domain-containing protein n=1 Tax=Elusimicrobium posterum TaxID=3116653 RepID=UPI003C723720